MRDECVVCLEETLTVTRECCNATVCDTCMSQHVTSRITSGVWMVVCPGEECDEKLEEGELLALLHQPETRNLYQRLKVDSNAVPNTKTCPKCKRITNVPAHRTTTQKYHKYGLKTTCKNCAFDWCFQCHSPAHPDTTCVIRTESPFQEWAGGTLYGEFSNAVQCPQCKTYVQHNGGCNNMKCSLCGKEFCYLCGDKACVHEGYIFGRQHPLTISFLSLHNLDETLMDLDHEYTRHLGRGPLAAGSTPRIPSLTCANFCNVWVMSVPNWMERRAEAGAVCFVFMCILMALLLLLLPISVPVTMLIVLACPRCRSRQYIQHDLEHRLERLRELRRSTLQLRRYTNGSISDERYLRDDSDVSSPPSPSYPQLTDREPARLYRHWRVPEGLRGDTAPPSPPSPYPHLTINAVSTRTASSPYSRFIIADDGAVLRIMSESSSDDQSEIAILLTPTNVTPGTELSSHDSDSPADFFLNVGETAGMYDETSGEMSTHSSRSVSMNSRLESTGKGSDSSSSCSISSLMFSATSDGSATFFYDSAISSDS